MRFLRYLLSELCVIFLLLGNFGGASASVIRVKADATGANDGSSWANAFASLTAALAAAQSGGEIWVAAGTYKPTSGTDRNQSFMMAISVAIHGGFAGSETERDQRDWKTHARSSAAISEPPAMPRTTLTASWSAHALPYWTGSRSRG